MSSLAFLLGPGGTIGRRGERKAQRLLPTLFGEQGLPWKKRGIRHETTSLNSLSPATSFQSLMGRFLVKTYFNS